VAEPPIIVSAGHAESHRHALRQGGVALKLSDERFNEVTL
jgi:hypothetical protein